MPLKNKNKREIDGQEYTSAHIRATSKYRTPTSNDKNLFKIFQNNRDKELKAEDRERNLEASELAGYKRAPHGGQRTLDTL